MIGLMQDIFSNNGKLQNDLTHQKEDPKKLKTTAYLLQTTHMWDGQQIR